MTGVIDTENVRPCSPLHWSCNKLLDYWAQAAYLRVAVLAVAGMECMSIWAVVWCWGLWFGFVAGMVLIRHLCFGCCWVVLAHCVGWGEGAWTGEETQLGQLTQTGQRDIPDFRPCSAMKCVEEGEEGLSWWPLLGWWQDIDLCQGGFHSPLTHFWNSSSCTQEIFFLFSPPPCWGGASDSTW